MATGWNLVPHAGASAAPPAGAPTGPPGFTGLFARYPFRPPFAVAGVDYDVGINAGITLTDWRTLYNTGGSATLTFYNQTAVVLDSIDFSRGGGTNIYFANCAGVRISNCLFGGVNLLRTNGGNLAFDGACTDITIEYNEIDGGGEYFYPIASISQSSPATVVTSVPHGVTNGVQVGFQLCEGMTQINFGSGAVTVIDLFTFTIPIDTRTFSPYTGGGYISLIQVRLISLLRRPTSPCNTTRSTIFR